MLLRKMIVFVLVAFMAFACSTDPENKDNKVQIISGDAMFNGATITPLGCASNPEDDNSFTLIDIKFFRVRPEKTECALKIEKGGKNVLDLHVNEGFQMGNIQVGGCALDATVDISTTTDGVAVFRMKFDETGKTVNYLCGERQYIDILLQLTNPLVDNNLAYCTDVNNGHRYQRLIPRSTKSNIPSKATLTNVMYSNRQKTPFICQTLMSGDFGNAVTQNAMVSDDGQMFNETGLEIQGQMFQPWHAQAASNILPHAGFLAEINQLGEVLLTDEPIANGTPVDSISNPNVTVKTNVSFSEIWLECSFFSGRVQMNSVTTNEFNYTYPGNIGTAQTYACNAYSSDVTTEKLFTIDSGYDMRMFINDVPVLDFILDNVKIVINEFGVVKVDMVTHSFRLECDEEMPAGSDPTVYYRYLFWKTVGLHSIGNNVYVSDQIVDPASYIEANASRFAGAEAVLERSNVDPFHQQTCQLYDQDTLLNGYLTYLYRVNWLYKLLGDGTVDPVLDADLIDLILSAPQY